MNTIPTHACRSDLELFGYTTCAHCNAMLLQDAAVVKVYYTKHQQHQEHFCSNNCKNAWYIKRLNTLGM